MIVHGDNLEILKTLRDSCIDSVVTDPPYGLSREPNMEEVLHRWLAGADYTHTGGGFMGQVWDSLVPGPAVWREVLRVLKPGGHALVFTGTRTYDLTVLATRLAGFEVRDQLAWMYGSGMPKGLDYAADQVESRRRGRRVPRPEFAGHDQEKGFGTCLKPAQEPIALLRKPLAGTLARNVLEHGTGGINVDGCRVSGRWPANVILDDEAARVLDGQTGGRASRFFYCSKASAAEREAGLADMPLTCPTEVTGRRPGSAGQNNPRAGMPGSRPRRNTHPTIKPIALMRWLVRLITPPGGIVLDPYAGSGSTVIAANAEGFQALGIELDEHYCEIARRRVVHYAEIE